MKKLTFRNIIIIVLLSIFVFSYVRQRVAIDRIEKQLNEKQLQLDEITKKNSRLSDEVEKIDSGSDEYLEKLARERLGMIKPGEKVINSSEQTSNSEK
ncbi:MULTISPECIES: septum formation initiator family protein [Clostridium]|uniref:FtsB family cell division protein n=1 Tax=Clostridium TaxID=1485 RepID=UPI00030D01C1|nr:MULTISPECIES: septum formation initiator family protein [Clostridium]MBN1043909.1 septum formation initiator family protein [Clostridium botulinum]NFJ38967.1 septum formation initiator family protein [Clostridium botulinum B str. Eklund 17B (NRP)]MBN1050586.1 septum formation initiator family protein [Clostridium botulinum]MBN1053872.1 septum formation initiator family protein [Clostridium botulinum]MBY6977305.1 septum formation initiator family protein [Clostridium botulinum]